MKKIPLLFLLMAMSFPAGAQDAGEEEPEAVPAPPEIPDQLQSGQPIEPEITIIREDEAVIEEYRVNGILYMVKITPDVGKPYYLVDRDGNGTMETRSRGIRDDPDVPQWILFSW